MSEEPQAGAFELRVQKERGVGTGPDWSSSYPADSVLRIQAAPTVEEAGVQATTEAVILLHSIRRILMWMLVIIPVLGAAAFITLLVIANAADPAACTSIYNC
ncbi:hypothetical protein [Lentzea albida]|uniref:Uncharacterized protein n=1 Tax=Lentzea albida TaxID=65499 RepID=A0A1H9RWR0_9PSEU|nr:hypothetical protein [Lentzea albida]SER77038.1 hypothetical protein SAMN04488000_111328 [Lentzea albida]